MTQPIDRETALQILTDAGCPNGYLASFALHHPQWDWMHLALNAAVAHSRKDAEPVAWLNPTSSFSVITQEEKNLNSLQYSDEFLAGHTTPLYAHPPEADKLLQQALEALEYRLQQTRPIHQADSVMEAIRTYLENKNA